jgi:hypothetical protein
MFQRPDLIPLTGFTCDHIDHDDAEEWIIVTKIYGAYRPRKTLIGSMICTLHGASLRLTKSMRIRWSPNLLCTGMRTCSFTQKF